MGAVFFGKMCTRCAGELHLTSAATRKNKFQRRMA
jgi:hypothetical protein